ncbi:hypothetical protein [Solidesulfovibrio sp.]
MFMPVYLETAAARLADWLEFQSIMHGYHEASLDLLWEAMGIAEDAPVDAFDEEDPDDVIIGMSEDTERERVSARVERELERRMEALGPAYPFVLEGGVLRFVLDTHKEGQLTYLLCLRLSLPLSEVLELDRLPPINTSNERNLFQHCANLAAAGYLGGKVYAFGWPRPDNTSFLSALSELERCMNGEGVVQPSIPRVALQNPKDDELDVVAWIPHNDGAGCALTLWGQVASGKNWIFKAFNSDRVEQFQHRWYIKHPVLQPVRAIFVPFSLFDDVHDRDPGEYVETLQDRTREYGIIFHRYRLPVCVQRAFDRADEVSVMKALPSTEVARLLQQWWVKFEDDLRHAAMRPGQRHAADAA